MVLTHLIFFSFLGGASDGGQTQQPTAEWYVRARRRGRK